MKKYLIILLAIVSIVTLCIQPAQADKSESISLDIRFQDALSRLDHYYDYNVFFMIESINRIMLERADDFWGSVTVSAEEYEAELFRYFAIDEDMLEYIRIDSPEIFYYNAEEKTYTCSISGGMGGSMPDRTYWGYIENGNTYDVYYQHISYGYLSNVLPEGVDEWEYAESLGNPETIEYKNHVYQPGPDGFYTVLSYDDYGRKYTVEENGDVIRIISCTEDAKIPERSYEFGDATLDGEINMNDVTAVMRHVLKAGELPETAIPLVDVNEDGTVNMDDVTALMRYVLKAETCLKHDWRGDSDDTTKTCAVCGKVEVQTFEK